MTEQTGADTARRRRLTRLLSASAAVATLVLTAGCTSAPTAEPAAPGAQPTSAAPSSPVPSSPPASSPVAPGAPTTSAGPEAEALTVDITIADGQVEPSGKKLPVQVGQQVVLRVTSDEADEIHAHTGGDGYELEVPAGKTTTGRFTLDSPGSFEVESHHLEKVIVILNAR